MPPPGNGRRIKRICLALMLCALAAGCQAGVSAPPPSTGWVAGTLRLGQRADFRSLDPAIANDTALVPIVRMIFQPLLDYDDGGIHQFVPLCRRIHADALERRQKRTLSHLKKGVAFLQRPRGHGRRLRLFLDAAQC